MRATFFTRPIHRSPRLFVFAALIALPLLLAACGGNKTDNSRGGMPGMSGSPTTSAAAIDQQFIDMMVPHHQSAIEMAKLAQTRAERPELKTLADTIITDQTKEIDQLKQWRKAWFGSDQTPSMEQMPTVPGMPMGAMQGMNSNGTMNMTTAINDLKTAQPFDKAFMQAMVQHHTQAIDAAKIAQEKTMRPEIKTLAGTIITNQQKEIDQLRGWLKAWYNA